MVSYKTVSVSALPDIDFKKKGDSMKPSTSAEAPDQGNTVDDLFYELLAEMRLP